MIMHWNASVGPVLVKIAQAFSRPIRDRTSNAAKADSPFD